MYSIAEKGNSSSRVPVICLPATLFFPDEDKTALSLDLTDLTKLFHVLLLHYGAASKVTDKVRLHRVQWDISEEWHLELKSGT